MSARPAKVCDHFDEKACELAITAQLRAGVTVAEICNVLAVALRNEHAKGYAEGLSRATNGPELIDGREPRRPTLMELAAQRTPQMDEELRQYAIGLGQRTRAPRDVRQRLYDLRRTIRDFDTQSDHDDTVLAGHPGFSGSGA